jgi:hypothetical protein
MARVPALNRHDGYGVPQADGAFGEKAGESRVCVRAPQCVSAEFLTPPDDSS